MNERAPTSMMPGAHDFDPSAVPVGRFHAWWRGDPLPALPQIPALVVEPVAAARIAREAIDLPPHEIRERMARGHVPWLARIGREPVGWGWSAASEFAIGELGIARVLPPRTRYLWDFFTRPEQRGRGIYPRLLQAMILGEPEVNQFWIGHDLDNMGSARGIAKAGFGEVGVLYREEGGFALVPSGALERAAAASELFDLPLAAKVSARR